MPTKPPTLKPRAAPGRVLRVPGASNRQTKRALHTGSKAWLLIRQQVLARDRYQCQQCSRFGDHVDHIRNDAAKPESNRLEALQTLCHSCHSAKTAKEMASKHLFTHNTRN